MAGLNSEERSMPDLRLWRLACQQPGNVGELAFTQSLHPNFSQKNFSRAHNVLTILYLQTLHETAPTAWSAVSYLWTGRHRQEESAAGRQAIVALPLALPENARRLPRPG
jgi:hypothetical protein